MNKAPLVSVVVPVYNGENYLVRCLDSLKNQDYENYEVICIDDGSTDKTAEIIKEYNYKYYYQSNAGQAAARNKGIDISNGDWICFVDSDDAVKTDYISSLVKGIVDDVGMVVCRINRINDDGCHSVDILKKYGIITSREALTIINIGPTNKLIKKSVIGDCRFIEGKLRFEDILFTPELLINSKKINVIENVLYDYYVRENSTMRRFDESLDDIFIVLNKLVEKPFYREYKEEIDYLVFKNGLFGHFSRIIYFDRKTIRNEMKKLRKYILSKVPNYWNNEYIKNDKQLYFYIGTRLFKSNLLGILILPLKIAEKRVNR